MNNLTESFKINKLNDLIGMDKYISHMNKWYDNINKIFILSLEGNTGIGKSLLAQLFLEHKDYNVMYFDISSIKSKSHIFDKIKESFRTFDICSMLQNKRKKIGYIIDNLDQSLLSKSEINELHSIFIKNKTIRPVILIGKYNKNTNYPKKKIDTLKMYNPTENTLFKIGKKIITTLKYSISDINLKIIIPKCQSDIKKLIILIDYFKKNKNIDIENIITKDCSYNLFNDFSNLISHYKPIKSSLINSDQVILLTYTFHQNIYNFSINNSKVDNIEHYLFDWNLHILQSIENEQYMTKTQNWDFLNYLYFNGPKYISYTYDKIKINKNITQQIDYPKYCYLSNQKNLYKKYIQIFKHFEFYDIINEDNFKLFVQSLFKNKQKNKFIFEQLKNDEIESLSKII
tara:strand:+ start:2501 stop:3706 length:1206 start_codon:yes stop_codon:yes gene_type:complete